MGARQYRDLCGKCGARRIDNQIGLESSPEAYVAKLVDVFREVKRLLRDDGTLWLNLGDSYNGSNAAQGGGEKTSGLRRDGRPETSRIATNAKELERRRAENVPTKNAPGIKPKDLIGIPWAVAKALQQPYYTGRIKQERDRVWLAATMDAEGTICGFTHVRKDNGETRRGVNITITNSNTRMLDEAYRIWATSRQEHNEHGDGHLGNLPTYRWIAHSVEDKQQLLAELYPYLICKKAQALLGWNFLEISKQARGRNKGVEGDDNRAKCAWIVDALSKLNHLESVDIPSWCKEPPSPHEEGYYLRSDIIWHKPNPMPESVTDRPTKSHEYIFLLSKSAQYFYDAEAIKEPVAQGTEERYAYAFGGKKSDDLVATGKWHTGNDGRNNLSGNMTLNPAGRNKRSVWTVTTKPYSGAHFATYPPDLIEPCILAGTSAHGCCAQCGAPWERVVEREQYTDRPGSRPLGGRGEQPSLRAAVSGPQQGGRYAHVETLGWQPTCLCGCADVVPCTVLDPFNGSGTTGAVALKHGRRYVGIDLNADYLELAHERIGKAQPLLFEVSA